VFEGVTLASPPGNERDEVGGDERGSEEEGEDDGANTHLGDGRMCSVNWGRRPIPAGFL